MLPPARDRDRRWIWLPVAAALVTLVLCVHAARLETPTVDEFAHVPAGCVYLTQHHYDLYAKNPPLFKELLALPVLAAGAVVPDSTEGPPGWQPWFYGTAFMEANRDRYFDLFFYARLVVIACLLLTGLLLFRWARSLCGTRGAAISTALFLLTPSLLAHGHLATLDVAAMLAITLAVFTLRGALLRPGWFRFGLAGVVWGAAMLVKFTAALLLPAFLFLLIERVRRSWRRGLVETAVVLFAAEFTINLGMGFSGSFRSLGSYELHSEFDRAAQAHLPSWLPVPLPADFVAGFDEQKRDTEKGEFGSYLAGRWSEKAPWYYNLVALGTKLPVPFLLMLVFVPGYLRRRHVSRRELRIVLIPLATLLLFLEFNRLGIGVRYLLPALPFLFLLIAPLWQSLHRAWAVAALAYYALAVSLVHPDYLSSFNLIGTWLGRHRPVLIDSNLDWGQDLYRVPGALRRIGYEGRIGLLYFGHVAPSLYGIDYALIPPRPVKGVLAVSVNFVMGAAYIAMGPDGRPRQIGRDHAAWLRSLEPVVRAGSIWIYDTRERR